MAVGCTLELWLPENKTRFYLIYPEVAFFRMDRNSGGGGVAVYTRASFTGTILNTVTVEKCFQFLAVKVFYG